ncbi:hypothetical protein scyTo_0010164 [Scyliorhinus torazame]|uniref:Uncharacterized protein n=1 Tax=Scyliorhinus torazame TaxID=75743 RepID=A0A401P191_SCYTO|nr:hypothetical protein [Scyliorhinus torazame]
MEQDWKQHARMGWERLQKYISSSKEVKSENIGNNERSNVMWAKSKSALHAHIMNDSMEQKNRRIIRYVKKAPLYHINRKHDVKYWYEEPTVGKRKKPQTLGTHGTFLGLCDSLRK